jgi:hypothetical protein
MDLSKLNYLAILVAALAAFVAGAIWFGPKTFFPVWWKAMGKTEDQQPGDNMGSMGVVFGLTALGQLVMSTTVAIVLELTEMAQGSISIGDGALIGLILGIGLAAASSLSHRLFAGQGIKVWIIEVASDVLNITILGIILAAWR